MREVFVMTGPDELLTFCGLNRVVDGDILMLHGIPWVKMRLKEFGLLNEDGEPKLELATIHRHRGLGKLSMMSLLCSLEKRSSKS